MRPWRILVVDDNEEHVRILVELLRLSGHKVQYAAGGVEALRVADRFYPELVLLDLAMPDMDGFKVLRKLRKHFPETRVYALTGQSSAEAKARVRRAGFHGYLGKPISVISIEELLSDPQNR